RCTCGAWIRTAAQATSMSAFRAGWAGSLAVAARAATAIRRRPQEACARPWSCSRAAAAAPSCPGRIHQLWQERGDDPPPPPLPAHRRGFGLDDVERVAAAVGHVDVAGALGDRPAGAGPIDPAPALARGAGPLGGHALLLGDARPAVEDLPGEAEHLAGVGGEG